MMNSDAKGLDEVQRSIWNARLPLEIRISPSESRAYDKSEPYLISVPRLSYLPFLLPRLFAFYAEALIADLETISADNGCFTFEGVPLKWHLPVGLLYDIYVLSTQEVNDETLSHKTAPSDKPLPFQLVVQFSQTADKHVNVINASSAIVRDSFINSVKEADFLRSGTAKPIMSMSAADSKLLWSSTEDNDLAAYSRIHSSLLPKNTPWRNIPIRVYLPSASVDDATSQDIAAAGDMKVTLPRGQIRVVQSQIPCHAPTASTSTTNQSRMPSVGQTAPQTLGAALNTLLPSLFPSKRTPIVAKPLLHGAAIPMNAALDEVASQACYADGWINIVVAITT